MKNHESRPTSSLSFPKVNENSYNKNGRGKRNKNGHGYHPYGGYKSSRWQNNKNKHNHKKWHIYERHMRQPRKNNDDTCKRCGRKGHWSHVCHEPMKDKGKSVEVNFLNESNLMNLDFSNFFIDENIDHLIPNVPTN